MESSVVRDLIGEREREHQNSNKEEFGEMLRQKDLISLKKEQLSLTDASACLC